MYLPNTLISTYMIRVSRYSVIIKSKYLHIREIYFFFFFIYIYIYIYVISKMKHYIAKN
ncbi:hypothetical protein PFUGPA_04716 [Plasmodium falciparum Palo Alto/Uganda]|uniref:Uncharacterized protein n=1 Tax=Plasmodium falciparum (isolate Palo Alto / Uganda) TaxID=57270 RepID=W4ISP7_PLAFP|nr:hypothetical protein PFUGPA_04716 [Plasmodium falciparum Palo Alto/Uganda]